MSFGYGGPFRPGYPDPTDYDNNGNSAPSSSKEDFSAKGIIGILICLIGVCLILFSIFWQGFLPDDYDFIGRYTFTYNVTWGAGLGGLFLIIIGFITWDDRHI